MAATILYFGDQCIVVFYLHLIDLLRVEKILLMPPLFAPAHELSRQIHVINAYCREAEYLQDPMQSTLWDLLDELIDAHERVAPKSLFAGIHVNINYRPVNQFLMAVDQIEKAD